MPIRLDTLEATKQCAKQLAFLCKPPFIVFLSGHLGAGKTTFVRAFLRAKHYQGVVKSPTYTLIEPYALDDCQVIHADFYRLSDSSEIAYLALDDLLHEQSIAFIEWPELACGYGVRADLHLSLQSESTSVRLLSLEAGTAKGRAVKSQWLQFYKR